MEYASLEDMKRWADWYMMHHRPDKYIGGQDNPYLIRWHVVPRNDRANVYLHHMLRSDDDRALHDHPWDNRSLLIDGSYIEVTPTASVRRQAGDIIERKATDAHRLVLIDDKPVISLFMTGPITREWGFHCPQGWRHWRDFTSGPLGETVGRGCD